MLIFPHLQCIRLLSKDEEALMGLLSYMQILAKMVDMRQGKTGVKQQLQILNYRYIKTFKLKIHNIILDMQLHI